MSWRTDDGLQLYDAQRLSSEVLFSILRQYDVPARMLRYVDDGHNAGSVASAMHRYREIKRWLDEHLLLQR